MKVTWIKTPVEEVHRSATATALSKVVVKNIGMINIRDVRCHHQQDLHDVCTLFKVITIIIAIITVIIIIDRRSSTWRRWRPPHGQHHHSPPPLNHHHHWQPSTWGRWYPPLAGGRGGLCRSPSFPPEWSNPWFLLVVASNMVLDRFPASLAGASGLENLTSNSAGWVGENTQIVKIPKRGERTQLAEERKRGTARTIRLRTWFWTKCWQWCWV